MRFRTREHARRACGGAVPRFPCPRHGRDWQVALGRAPIWHFTLGLEDVP